MGARRTGLAVRCLAGGRSGPGAEAGAVAGGGHWKCSKASATTRRSGSGYSLVNAAQSSQSPKEPSEGGNEGTAGRPQSPSRRG